MWEQVRRALLNSLSATSQRVWKWVRAFWQKNGLLTLSMLSVATGCLLGFLLRALELTELVSLAGMGTGARGMGQSGRLARVLARCQSRGPDRPQKQRFLPKKMTPEGRFLPPASFHWDRRPLGRTLRGCRSLQAGRGWERGERMLGCETLGKGLPPAQPPLGSEGWADGLLDFHSCADTHPKPVSTHWRRLRK